MATIIKTIVDKATSDIIAPRTVIGAISNGMGDNLQNLLDDKVSQETYLDTLYVHPTTAGNKHIPTGGTVGQIMTNSANGTAVWGDPVAGVTIVNGLTETVAGKALDATQGKVLNEQISSILEVKTATITTTWTGASAPYTQTVAVSGITVNDEPVISPVYSTTNATAISQKTAWNCIGKIVTNAGSITVTCFETKPVTAIPIQIKGV